MLRDESESVGNDKEVAECYDGMRRAACGADHDVSDYHPRLQAHVSSLCRVCLQRRADAHTDSNIYEKGPATGVPTKRT